MPEQTGEVEEQLIGTEAALAETPETQLADEPKTEAAPSTEAVAPPEPEPDRVAIAGVILADENLPPEDYAKAQENPEYLQALVDAYLEEQGKEKEEKSAAAGKETAGAKSEAEAEAAETKGEKPKKLGGYQRQILNLRRENEELQERLQELKERSAKPKADAGAKPSEPETTAASPRPNRDDFIGDDDGYTEALIDWKAEQKTRAILEEARQNAAAERQRRNQQDAQNALETAWAEQLEAGREHHADFDEVVLASEVPLTEPMRLGMIHTGRAGDIAHWMATHPKEAGKLSRLSPAAVLVEIGKLDATLKRNNSTSPAPKTQVSQTPPPPPKTVGAGAKTVRDRAYYGSDLCSPAEYEDAVRSGKLR